ncbi:MAG: RDD family protein [Actinomycetota bacterium]|nr:RDD family protein [Actinomycetota bacterium]
MLRVGAWFVDAVPILLAWAVFELVTLATGGRDCAYYNGGDLACSSAGTEVPVVLFGVGAGLSLGYLIWNLGYLQGTRGSSIGKSVVKIKVVSERTWQPIGFGRSVLRQLAHVLDVVPCLLGFVLPLVDPRRQTLADKVTSSVCVPLTPRVTDLR